jgi:hypothetical protein
MRNVDVEDHDVVKDLEWARDSTEVRWFGPDGYVNKSYGQPPVRVLRLEGGPGVVVVEPRLQGQANRLVAFNADGSVRFRMVVPGQGLAFHDVYYVGRELTAIVAFLTADFAYVLDGNTGEVLRSYETR